ncbi:MAG TPA: zf-HC2 domain-containing protein [Gemmatimonadota bacterium]|jgi:hypothetical protein
MERRPVESGHERWEDLIVEVLDGGASADRAELDEHLALCPSCRIAFEEYAALFARLRSTGEGEMPAAFWEDLAADVERRIGEEPVPVIDLPERAGFGAGWGAVRGALIAAGLATVVLVGVYLELPRQTGDPQAFVRPPRVPAAAGPAEPGAGEGAVARASGSATAGSDRPGSEDVEAAALATLAGGLADEDADLTPALGDPLADLAEAELTLQGLSPEEAEELLQSLEAQT